MRLEFAIPALELSTGATLLLVFNSRLLTITQLIRDLSGRYQKDQDNKLAVQVRKLHKQATILRDIKIVTIVSLLLCIITMFLMFNKQMTGAVAVFTTSLILLGIAMILTIAELLIATNTLNLTLDKELKSNYPFFRFRKPKVVKELEEQLFQEGRLN